jgi:putative colanic acid biosysnthesis UDP-glucose lipid carrier transferase
MNHSHKFSIILFKIVDCLAIFLAAGFIRIFILQEWKENFLDITAQSCIVFLLTSELFNLHRDWRGSWVLKETFEVAYCWLIVTLGIAFSFAFLINPSPKDQFFALAFSIAGFAFLCLGHASIRMILRKIRQKQKDFRRVALVGAGELSHKIGEYFMNYPDLAMKPIGVYDDRQKFDKRSHWNVHQKIPQVGNFENLLSAVKTGLVDTVLLCLPYKAQERTQDLLNKLADTTVSVYSVHDPQSLAVFKGAWQQFGEFPVTRVFESPFRGLALWLKAGFDTLFSLLLLLLFSPILSVIALLVKLSSPGPIIFKQERYGLKGEKILVWKFRTMSVCENNSHEISQATKGDKRITRIGAFLRSHSLDELPQLFNVLKGEMSLVGPRPHASAHNEFYRKQIKGYMQRHMVKPGITGWAQVNGWRGETEVLEKMNQRIQYDLEYICNWSFLFDIKILIKTIFHFKTPNAY